MTQPDIDFLYNGAAIYILLAVAAWIWSWDK